MTEHCKPFPWDSFTTLMLKCLPGYQYSVIVAIDRCEYFLVGLLIISCPKLVLHGKWKEGGCTTGSGKCLPGSLVGGQSSALPEHQVN